MSANHSWSGGFYTSAKVLDAIDVNHSTAVKGKTGAQPHLSGQGGQNGTNQHTETNDTIKN